METSSLRISTKMTPYLMQPKKPAYLIHSVTIGLRMG